MTVRYLFFRIRVLPQQEKKKKAAGGQKQEKKKAQAEQTEETKNKIREILKKKGVSSLVELLSEAASLAVSVLKRFFSHVHISLFDLFLLVAAEAVSSTHLIGWNSLSLRQTGGLFSGLEAEPYVYFVHSYYLHADDPSIVSAQTQYGVCIDAAVCRGSLHAVQFHPEKSGKTCLLYTSRCV